MYIDFFGSDEDARKRLKEALKAAGARGSDWREAIAPGDCFIGDSHEGYFVFGEVLGCYPEPCFRNHRFCRCYSAAYPEGREGRVHISNILCIICRSIFEDMRQKGWRFGTASEPRRRDAPPDKG